MGEDECAYSSNMGTYSMVYNNVFQLIMLAI